MIPATQKANDYLQHHGILGQKWGVRRYQNYDGSYTQRGLKRYSKNKETYDASVNNYQQKKNSYKNGEATKQEVIDAKVAKNKAKKEMSKSYDKLKTDKMADQGKELYSKGKTITDNMRASQITQTTIVIGSVVTNKILSQCANQTVANLASTAIALGGTTINALSSLKINSENKKLRAYYTHH